MAEITLIDAKELDGRIANIVETVLANFFENREQQRADTEAAMLTRDELCERWHISPATLGNYQRAGRIKPTRLGGRRVLYALADVRKAEAKR